MVVPTKNETRRQKQKIVRTVRDGTGNRIEEEEEKRDRRMDVYIVLRFNANEKKAPA